MSDTKDMKSVMSHPALAILGKLRLAQNCMENASGFAEIWISSELMEGEPLGNGKEDLRTVIMQSIACLESCLESM